MTTMKINAASRTGKNPVRLALASLIVASIWSTVRQNTPNISKRNCHPDFRTLAPFDSSGAITDTSTM